MRYLIIKGDTLSKIAKSHGVSVDAIMAANPAIKNRDKILAGKVINVPVPNGDRPSLWREIRDRFGRW